MADMDPKLTSIVERIADQVESRYEDMYGEIDGKARHSEVLDTFDEEYEDIVPVALRTGWSFMVWEILRKRDGKGRARGVAEMMSDIEKEVNEPRLPSEEWAQTAVYNVPVGNGKHEKRKLYKMSREQIRATRRDYEKRGREMFQQARPLRAYEQEMDRREFRETDTVRDLYRKTS